MTKRILFSPVGTTDPYRDDFEGPMLHIVRHYNPEDIIIFLTEEMLKKSSLDDRYCRAVMKQAEVLGRDISRLTIRVIESGIQDPSDFNGFSQAYQAALKQINETNPDAEILINVTSGSPQMIATASLLASSGFMGKSYTCVQVVTHKKSSGSQTPYTFEYSESAIADLLDNDPEADNRCRIPDIQFFERIKLREQLVELLNQYDYSGAARLVDQSKGFFNGATVRWVKHYESRVNFNRKAAVDILSADDLKSFDPFPVINRLYLPAFEYFLGVQVKFLRGEWTDFLLRMSPLLTELARLYLTENLRFNLDAIIDQRSVDRKITSALITRNDPDLLVFLNTQFTYGYKDGSLSLNVLLMIIRYCVERQKSVHDQAERIVALLEPLRTAESKLRNLAAHEMIAFTNETVKRMPDLMFNSFEEIHRCLMDLIGLVIGSHLKSSWRDLPQRINKWIIMLLDN